MEGPTTKRDFRENWRRVPFGRSGGVLPQKIFEFLSSPDLISCNFSMIFARTFPRGAKTLQWRGQTQGLGGGALFPPVNMLKEALSGFQISRERFFQPFTSTFYHFFSRKVCQFSQKAKPFRNIGVSTQLFSPLSIKTVNYQEDTRTELVGWSLARLDLSRLDLSRILITFTELLPFSLKFFKSCSQRMEEFNQRFI